MGDVPSCTFSYLLFVRKKVHGMGDIRKAREKRNPTCCDLFYIDRNPAWSMCDERKREPIFYNNISFIEQESPCCYIMSNYVYCWVDSLGDDLFNISNKLKFRDQKQTSYCPGLLSTPSPPSVIASPQISLPSHGLSLDLYMWWHPSLLQTSILQLKGHLGHKHMGTRPWPCKEPNLL